MTSTIKVNTVTTESGSTLTLGGCGKTVALASGASQTGFGRTGTVNWDTTKKTAGFTGENGRGYFIDTSSGAITVNLPASPSAGDIMALADYAGTAANNNITVGRNGSNIEGVAEDGKLTANRESKTLVFVDATQGWVPVNDNFDEVKQIKFVAATGGAEATSGNFKIHTFTGPGTFCVSCAGNPSGSTTVDYLVVAGGGGGGRGCSHGAGGGAGGYRESSGAASGCYAISPLGACVAALPVTATGFPITVGGGGAGASSSTSPSDIGSNGSNSIFSTRTSTGGGGGAGWSSTGGNPGGSGGGAACSGTPTNFGTGNTPSVSPPQGNPGGSSVGSRMGGGGGAGEAGNTDGQGHGGDGVASSINGTPTTRAGGGSGGGSSCSSASIPGGDGGGGTGRGSSPPGNGGAGTVNTGGGGGGSFPSAGTGGAGGSGIVIIRYKFQ